MKTQIWQLKILHPPAEPSLLILHSDTKNYLHSKILNVQQNQWSNALSPLSIYLSHTIPITLFSRLHIGMSSSLPEFLAVVSKLQSPSYPFPIPHKCHTCDSLYSLIVRQIAQCAANAKKKKYVAHPQAVQIPFWLPIFQQVVRNPLIRFFSFFFFSTFQKIFNK